MGKPSAPQAPDPYNSAAAQYKYGTQAAAYNAALNRMNTVGPTGSTQYQVTGTDPTGAPIYTQRTQLTPTEQALLNSQEQVGILGNQTALGQQGIQLQQQGLQRSLVPQGGNALSQLRQVTGQGAPQTPGLTYGIDTSNVPGLISPQTGFDYGQGTALKGELAAINPSMQQEKEQLDASLRNSGAHPGDPAYDNAMMAEDARQANAYAQAGGAAITAGTGLSNSLFNQALQGNQTAFGQAQAQSGLRNTAVSQALQNYATQAGIPLSQLQGIMQMLGTQSGQIGAGGAQSGQANVPQAIAPGTSQTSAPDIMNAMNNQYQGQLSNYNAQVAQQNSLMGDASGLLAAFMLMPK
jgi:hypothetical protein